MCPTNQHDQLARVGSPARHARGQQSLNSGLSCDVGEPPPEGRPTPARIPLKAYLTVAELADWLGVSRSWVYQRTSTRRLPHVKLGAAIRFVPEDVEAWLSRGKVATPSGPRDGRRS